MYKITIEGANLSDDGSDSPIPVHLFIRCATLRCGNGIKLEEDRMEMAQRSALTRSLAASNAVQAPFGGFELNERPGGTSSGWTQIPAFVFDVGNAARSNTVTCDNTKSSAEEHGNGASLVAALPLFQSARRQKLSLRKFSIAQAQN
jgi:hypothetical protein